VGAVKKEKKPVSRKSSAKKSPKASSKQVDPSNAAASVAAAVERTTIVVKLVYGPEKRNCELPLPKDLAEVDGSSGGDAQGQQGQQQQPPPGSFSSFIDRIEGMYGTNLHVTYREFDCDTGEAGEDDITVCCQEDLDVCLREYKRVPPSAALRSRKGALEFKVTTKMPVLVEVEEEEEEGGGAAGAAPMSRQSSSSSSSTTTSRGGGGFSRQGSAMMGASRGGSTPIQQIKHWQRGQFLGKGAFGKVYLGLNLESGGMFALKQVSALRRS
jgi:hypothetical protein